MKVKDQVLRLLLVLVFLSQAAFADDRGESVPSQIVEEAAASTSIFNSSPTIDENRSLDKIESAALDGYAENQVWASQLEIKTQDLLKLRAEVFDLADERDVINSKEVGDTSEGIEKTNQEISNGNVNVVRKGLGRMKLTICEGRRIAVFFEDATARAIIIYEDGEISPNSRQLKTIVSTYHVLGNDEVGRDDVVLMELHADRDPKVTLSERARSIWERKWWADQFYGKYRHPDKNAWSSGLAIGMLLQGVASAIVTGIAYKTGITPDFQVAPILVAMGFGGVLGVWSETYNNLAYKGKYLAWKQAPVSILFTSAMMYAAGAGDHFWSIRFQATNLVSILAAKSLISLPWRKPIKLRTDLRENSGKYRFRAFGQDFAWDKAMAERSLFYLIPFFIKNFDYFFRKYETLPLVDIWSQHIPYIEHMPKLLELLHMGFPYFQISGAILAVYLQLKYLKYLANRPVVVGKWPQNKSDEMKGLLDKQETLWSRIWNVAGYPKVIADGLLKFGSQVLNRCQTVMNSLRSNTH